MRFGKSRVLPALLLSAGLAVPTMALAASKATVPMTDAQLQSVVQQKVAELGREASGVTVQAKDGVVTLSGTVPSVWWKHAAMDHARKAGDAKSVVSDLSIATAESDDAIANLVAKELRRYVFYTVYDDVNGRVREGVVTLTGEVTAPYKASDMADLAARVHGVSEVVNEIKTLPVSLFDDQLRVKIARAIYRDQLFWNYAIQVNPPIHVVVENGHVKLTGVVNSEVERRKAEVIARTTFGSFSVVNELRLDSEMRGTKS
jgi:hyperosmotically inducible periplasmic protein